jgi:hypothetical protein
LATLYLSRAKNTDSWHIRKVDLQRAFPQDVLIVPSSAITSTANGEHLTCGGFSLSETVRLGNFKFITDYFGGLSLSLRRGDAVTTFMGSTHIWASTPRWAMIEDSIAHDVKQGGELRPPLSQKVRHRGFTRSHQNHIMAEGHPRHHRHTAGGELPPMSSCGLHLESLGHFIEPAKSYF